MTKAIIEAASDRASEDLDLKRGKRMVQC